MTFPILVTFLRNDRAAQSFSVKDWELLIRQARAAKVLATLTDRLEKIGHLHTLDRRIRSHFENAKLINQQQNSSVKHELLLIRKALAPSIEITLLKGAAYLEAELSFANGRMFNDIDLLFPKAQIADVESKLLLHGWVRKPVDEYDERYYREWMHEIPPLIHVSRGSVLDVHHNIVPTLKTEGPDPGLLLDKATTIGKSGFFNALAPVDMVIHSAAHLFLETEFTSGLRDLLDLDGLFRECSQADDNFWNQLAARSDELLLSQHIRMAIYLCNSILNTPVPERLLDWSTPRRLKQKWSYHLLSIALMPRHSSCDGKWLPLIDTLLLARGHLLKMPLTMLIPHRIRKAAYSVTELLKDSTRKNAEEKIG